MSFDLSRRQALRLLGFLSAGTAVGSVPLISKLFADRANAQTGNVFVRENIFTFIQSPQKVASLRKGIQVMLSRPATDPTSWIYQANIHGTTDQPSRTAWNTCDHRTFFFFPWHRMYLYYFERILRQASGDSNLTLPYWNYSDVVEQRVLPEPFRIPADPTTNPLYVSQRASDINQGAALAAAEVSYTAAFRRTNFFHTTDSGQSFGGRRVSQTAHRGPGGGVLEGQPHNQIHTRVGGSTGWMRSVELAARDPIFWLHHANIDRLWERWLQQGGGRANPTNDSDWMNDRFTFFDETGTQVTKSGSEILNTASQLNYRYDDAALSSNRAVASSIQGINPNAQPQQVAMSAKSQELVMVLSSAPVTLTAPFQQLGARALTAESALTLNVEGVEYNPTNSIPFQIYVNLPEGVAPDPNSPYYAGRLALFSLPQKGTFRLDITDVVSELQRRNLMTGAFISITFVPPPGEIPKTIVSQGSSTQMQGAVRFSGATLTRE